MTITRSRFQRLARLAIFLVAAAAVLAYALWRSYAYVKGPYISIDEPVDGSIISSTTVEVSGRALRVAAIAMNGYPITIDQNGDFNEALIVFPGPNTLTISAADQFGRTVKKSVEIWGKAALPAASSSAATSTPAI